MKIPTKEQRKVLRAIRSPYGMLYEQLRNTLFSAWNEESGDKSNIQAFAATGKWIKTAPTWCNCDTYRLDPEWEPPKKEQKYVRCKVVPAYQEIGALAYQVPGKEATRCIEFAQWSHRFIGYEFKGGWISDHTTLYYNEEDGDPEVDIHISYETSVGDLTDPAEGYKVGILRPIAVWFKKEPVEPVEDEF